MPGRTAHLDDATISEVVHHHGAIGLNFIDTFVSYKNPADKVTVTDPVEEIVYVKQHYGIDYVALGPDFIPSSDQRDTCAQGIERMADLRNVAIEMVHRGFSEDEIKKVLGGNLLNLYRRVWNQSACREAN
jgi:membrane dipeptidase